MLVCYFCLASDESHSPRYLYYWNVVSWEYQMSREGKIRCIIAYRTTQAGQVSVKIGRTNEV